eukprot:1459291-Prymnesium_polylepis.1
MDVTDRARREVGDDRAAHVGGAARPEVHGSSLEDAARARRDLFDSAAADEYGRARAQEHSTSKNVACALHADACECRLFQVAAARIEEDDPSTDVAIGV